MNLSVLSQHQIYSSSFVTDEWIKNFVLSNPISSYSPTNFQKIVIGIFQLLASLCKLSQEYLTDELSDLMTRSFINSHIISCQQFHEQIESIMNQFQENTPISFLATLQLIRNMISDNTLMSVFETNYGNGLLQVVIFLVIRD